MISKKLAKMPYANAHVEIERDGTITLVSYTTPVVIIQGDGWMRVRGLYSMTTRRHISRFMDEYTDHNFCFAKTLYENGEEYNVKTGEYKAVDFKEAV